MKIEGLQTYRCHKVVQAAKILIVQDVPETGVTILTLATLPDKSEVEVVGPQWWQRAHVGGYYVRYEDDYASFSPADPFESGYTAVTVPDPKAMTEEVLDLLERSVVALKTIEGMR